MQMPRWESDLQLLPFLSWCKIRHVIPTRSLDLVLVPRGSPRFRRHDVQAVNWLVPALYRNHVRAYCIQLEDLTKAGRKGLSIKGEKIVSCGCWLDRHKDSQPYPYPCELSSFWSATSQILCHPWRIHPPVPAHVDDSRRAQDGRLGPSTRSASQAHTRRISPFNYDSSNMRHG